MNIHMLIDIYEQIFGLIDREIYTYDDRYINILYDGQIYFFNFAHALCFVNFAENLSQLVTVCEKSCAMTQFSPLEIWKCYVLLIVFTAEATI